MRTFLTYLGASYNVWFTAPLAIMCLFALFRLLKGAMNFSEADIDTDVDIETGVDADTKVHRLAFSSVFGFFNIGRIPLTVVMMLLFATWGIAGLIMNSMLDVPNKPQWIWVSFTTAIFCCLFGTRYILAALLKLLPQRKKAISDVQLLGLSGRVISGRITTTFGTARLRVPDGPELTVSCRAKSDETTPVKGDTVILIDYDQTKRIFDVRKAELIDAD